MNIYTKDLISRIGKRYGKLSSEELAEKLLKIGVIDHTLCKVLSIREYVLELVRNGDKKVDAMWKASEHFCCSYEYIRKCEYYYKDINMD